VACCVREAVDFLLILSFPEFRKFLVLPESNAPESAFEPPTALRVSAVRAVEALVTFPGLALPTAGLEFVKPLLPTLLLLVGLEPTLLGP